MSYGYDGDFIGYNNFRHPILDRNHDGQITEGDFAVGARQMGFGLVGESVARSAFRKFDKNHDGVLSREDALGAYGSLHRLYY